MILQHIAVLLFAVAVSGCWTRRPTNPPVSMASTWADARSSRGPLDFPGGTSRVAVARVSGLDIFPQNTEPNRPWLMFGVFTQSPDDSIESVVRFAKSRGAEFLVVHQVTQHNDSTYVLYRAGRYGSLPK